MPKIPFTVRRDGRYYFRRRARWENGNDLTVIIPLSTCNAQEARGRSAAVAAHFDRVRKAVGAYFELNRTLEPDMLKALFESELRSCLKNLVDEFHDEANNPHALVERFRTHASAYDLAQRPGSITDLSESHRQKLLEAGHDEDAIEWVACDLDRYCGKNTIDDEMMALMAEGLGVEPTAAVIGRMKHIHLLAKAEAHRLATHFLDEDVQSTFDQEEALLAKRRPNGEPLTFAPPTTPRSPTVVPSSPAVPVEVEESARNERCAFKTYHAMRFSEVIPKILRLARRGRHWNRGLAQYERVLRTFAWVTGDKPLGEYNHTDVARFKNALLDMPRDYRPSKDFDRSYEEVAATFEVSSSNARSLTTVKRDLAYMSTAHDILAEDEWAPKIPNTKVLDFPGAKLGKHKKASKKTARPAWTREHMKCLFSAPIWTGGGGHLHRLDAAADNAVWHDAAYWLPLLLYYTHAALNEIAGLRADEVQVDDLVPNIVIQDNDVRAEDDVKGGEKNENRGRLIPLHSELLRLGFLDYVRAIRAEGHKELFPELFCNEARVGGHQFRNVAWRHMVAWIGLHMSIPTNSVGKSADMHSIRALGSSFYATADVPDFMRADVMGHARTGTNALHYSKRAETHGVQQVLSEYLAFMAKNIDVSTAELDPLPVKLLPLRHRSRTGKPKIRGEEN